MTDKTASRLDLESIGVVRSKWDKPGQPPHQGPEAAVQSVIEIDPRWAQALTGLEPGRDFWVICYFHRSRTPDLMVHPRGDRSRPATGMFNTRTPHRPGRLSLTLVRLMAVDGAKLTVEGLEMIDGTPVVDIKPYVPAVDRPRGQA